MKFLLVALLLFLVVPFAHAEGVVDLSAEPEVPGTFNDLVVFLTGPWSLIVWGLLFLAMIYRAWRHQDYDGAIILGALVFIGVLVRAALFNDPGSTQGWFTAEETTRDAAQVTDYAFPVYGSDPATEVHFSGETASYEMIRGWSMAGATLFFRILDWGFTSYFIQAIIFFGFLMKVWEARQQRSLEPVVLHGVWIFIGGWLLLWPSVEIRNDFADNPVIQVASGVYEEDTSEGDYVDQPRLTKAQVMVFSFMTDLTESIGSRLKYNSKEGDSRILDAALEARLADDHFELYMDYATQCFTSVQNARAIRKKNTPDQLRGITNIIERSIGTEGDEGRGGFVAEYLRAPMHARHALAPHADAMLRGIMPSHFVPYPYDDNGFEGNFSLAWNSRDDKLAKVSSEYFDGTYYPNGLPSEFDPHPSILSGYGPVTLNAGDAFFDDGKESGMRHIDGAVNGISVENALARNESVDVLGSSEEVILLPVCSGYTGQRIRLDGSADIAQPVTDASMGRFLHSQGLNGLEIDRIRLLDLGDYVRIKIAKRYFDAGAAEFCEDVSFTRNSEHVWGCLVSGAFRRMTPENMHQRSMAELQDVFDDEYLPALIDHWEGVAGMLPAGEYRAREYANSDDWHNHLGGPSTAQLDAERRAFLDIYMSSPNIVGQIGVLKPSSLASDEEERSGGDGGLSGWIWDFFTSVAGYVAPTLLGIFGWFASLVAKFMMMIYPHVLGLATFFLLLMYLPFAVFSLFPGKSHIILEWVKCAVWILLWPLFITLGLSLINHGGSFGMASLALRAENGPGITEPVLKLFGAAMIFGAGAFAAGLLSLSFAGLSQGVNLINSSATKIVGGGAALTGVATVFAAKLAIGGGLLAAAAGSAGARRLSGGGGSQPPRLGGPGGPDGGGPRPSGGGGNRGGGNGHGPGGRGGGGAAGGEPSGVRVREVVARSVSHADRAGGRLQQAMDFGMFTAASAASMGGMGSELGQGMVAGRGAGQGVAAAVRGGAAMAAGGALRLYDRFRGHSGALPDGLEHDDVSARQFASNAHNFDRLAESAERLGQPGERVAALSAAGASYSDQSRLAGHRFARVQASLRAFERFNEAGDQGRAAEEAAFAHQQLAGFEPQDDASAAFVQDARARLAIGRTRVVVADRLPDAPQAVQEMSSLSESSIAFRSEQIDHQVRDQQSWSGDVADFAGVANHGIAQLRVAMDTDAVNEQAVDANVDGAQRSHLTDTVLGQFDEARSPLGNMGHDQRQRVLRGAMLAGAGQSKAAQRSLRGAGLSLTSEDMERLQREIRNGQTGMFEDLLRRARS